MKPMDLAELSRDLTTNAGVIERSYPGVASFMVDAAEVIDRMSALVGPNWETDSYGRRPDARLPGGGYQPSPGGSMPPVPTVGSGVRPPIGEPPRKPTSAELRDADNRDHAPYARAEAPGPMAKALRDRADKMTDAEAATAELLYRGADTIDRITNGNALIPGVPLRAPRRDMKAEEAVVALSPAAFEELRQKIDATGHFGPNPGNPEARYDLGGVTIVQG